MCHSRSDPGTVADSESGGRGTEEKREKEDPLEKMRDRCQL